MSTDEMQCVAERTRRELRARQGLPLRAWYTGLYLPAQHSLLREPAGLNWVWVVVALAGAAAFAWWGFTGGVL